MNLDLTVLPFTTSPDALEQKGGGRRARSNRSLISRKPIRRVER